MFYLKLNKILVAVRKEKDMTMKKILFLIGVVLALASPLSAYADDVLEKLNSIEIAITNLTKKIDALETKLAAIEKALIKTPKEPDKTIKVEPKTKQAAPAGSDDFASIGGGFLLGSVNHKASLGDTIFSGEIENQSIKSYKTAIFNIKVLDEKGATLGGSDFYLQELFMGAKVPFEVTVFGVKKESIARYEIKFDRGF